MLPKLAAKGKFRKTPMIPDKTLTFSNLSRSAVN